MNQKRLITWVCFGVGIVVMPLLGLAQPIEHLEVNASVGFVTNGVPFTVTLRALHPDGLVATNWQGQVGLFAFRPGTGTPVITEVFKSGGTIEIANPGEAAIDLSGWELEALPDYPYYGGNPAAPNARLRFPAGTWLPGQGVITWSDRGVPPGAFPAFVSPKPLTSVNGFYVARLLNGAGEIVDEVYLRSWTDAPENAFWKGVGLAYCPTNCSYSRIGFANHFRNLDWVTNSPTLGTWNPGLKLPWTPSGMRLAASPAVAQLSNGLWTGSVTVSGVPAGTTWLQADNGAGIAGTSAGFVLVERPGITLRVPPGVSVASEATAGLAGYITVQLPDVVAKDRPITLTLSDTNEFDLPAQVTIPAGTNAVLVPITNLDDSFPDGDAVVTLTAMTPGYGTASATLLNQDDEPGSLFVIVPPVSLPEDCGFSLDPGRVFLSAPARHDVLVRLSAAPPLEAPESLVIPKGRLSQSFRLRVGSDTLANPSPWQVPVRAQTANWPWAEARLTLLDDEDGSFVLSLPPAIVEGTTATGLIQVKTPHQADTTFTLTSSNGRLRIPAQVTLSAGTLSTNFFLEVTNNATPDPQLQVKVCAQTAGQSSVCNYISVLDDEVNIQGLIAGRMPRVVFSHQPFTFSALLGNASGQPQLTNTSGHLEVLAAPQVARLEPGANPLQFTNGAWTNQIQLTGEALGIQLRVAAAGFQADSARFDLLPGLEIPIALVDAAWNQASGKFLVAEAAQTNAPARLTEIDPWTGARGRSLDLPRPVQRITLSADGQVAWLASTTNTLQRINLAAWQFDREFKLEPVATSTYLLDLAVLPGESERLVAVTSTNRSTWRVVLYDHGLPATNQATLPGSGITTVLAPGRAGEVFCQSFGYLSRFLVASNGVTLDRSIRITSSSSETPNLAFSGDSLFRGTGEVFLPDTLAIAAPFATKFSLLGLPCTDQGAALFIEQGTLKAYDVAARQARGAHALPDSAAAPARLLRWSERGFATLSTAARVLTIFQTPLLTTNLPDLVLTVRAPASVMVPPDGTSATFTWEFGITNQGTVPALGVELRRDSSASYPLGTLAPGEGASVSVQAGSFYAGIFSTRATALCAIPDANPQDNTLTAVTRVRKQDLPSASQLILGLTHLIASPGGDRLYAAVATSAGESQDGVAVVNPEAGTVEEVLPIGPNPQRLAISPDGANLYVLLGTNQLVRWNLPAHTNDLALWFTNETILDFAPNPADSRSVVVATKTRLAVFDDARMRPGTFDSPSDRRYLGYADGKLWSAEPGYLRSFTLANSGLSVGTNIAFTLFSDYYRFASDGRHLFFSGAIVDTLNGQKLSNWLGDQFCVDPATDSLFSPVGYNMRRYSLSTYQLLGEQWLSQANGTLQDPVRWGNGGLAGRCGQQLLMVRSLLVPAASSADLTVSVIPPLRAFPYEPMEWSIILTNNSDQPAPRSMLTVNWGDLRDLQIEGPYSFQTHSTLLYDAGDMPAHAGASLKIRGWSFGGTMSLSATVQTAASDPNAADNTAAGSIAVNSRVADLGILSVSAPARVQSGDEFEATFVVTNAGPEVANTGFLELRGAAGLRFLGVTDPAFSTNEYGVLLGSIEPGTSKTAVLRYQALTPGFMPVSAYAEGSISDPQSGNNRNSAWVYAAPAQTNSLLTELTFPARPILSWDRSRRQVLAAFPDNSWSLFVLSPAGLEPLREIPLPGLPEFIAPCQNGRQAWVSLAGGGAVRVDLTTGSLDQQFAYDPAQCSVYSVATPPGQSNLLVVAYDPGFTGNNHLQVFDNGIKRPVGYGPLDWAGGGEPMLFTPDGRLFLASSQILRQLQLTANGLAEVRNLDTAGLYSGLGLSYAANRLFFSEGRVLNLNTATVDDTLLDSAVPLVADEETGWAYTASPSRLLWNGPPMTIRRFDATTLALQWSQVLSLPSSEVSSILPMGTNGCAVIGDKIWLLNAERMGAPSADLALAVSPPASAFDGSVPFPLQVAVTNKSLWTAQQTLLSVELPEGLVFAPRSPGAGSATATVNLGPVNGNTNLTFLVQALTSGSFALRAALTSSLPDPVPTDNQQELLVTVAPPPLFLFDDTLVQEGSSYRPGILVGWLSRPALTNVSATFTVSLLTAQSNDFSSLSGAFQFAAGQTRATFSPIVADSTPELDETATLVFSSTNLVLARPTALLTLLNDDFPQVNVTNVTLAEGNSGYTNGDFKVTLSAAAPFSVDVSFQVTPGTATPGTDFLAPRGWLHFNPGETLKTLSVPILGDTLYEPNETASFELLQAVQAGFATAQALLTINNDDLPAAPEIAISPVADGIQIHFRTVPGATYQLQSRTNFTTDTWRTLSGSIQGNGDRLSFTRARSAQNSVFYRVTAK